MKSKKWPRRFPPGQKQKPSCVPELKHAEGFTAKGIRAILRKKFNRLELLVSPVSLEPPFRLPEILGAVWNRTRSLYSLSPGNERRLLWVGRRLELRLLVIGRWA